MCWKFIVFYLIFQSQPPNQYGIWDIGHKENNILLTQHFDKVELYHIYKKNDKDWKNEFAIYYSKDEPSFVQYDPVKRSFMRMNNDLSITSTFSAPSIRKVIDPFVVDTKTSAQPKFKYFWDYININYILETDTIVFIDIMIDDSPIAQAIGLSPNNIHPTNCKNRLIKTPNRFIQLGDMERRKHIWYYPLVMRYGELVNKNALGQAEKRKAENN